TTLMNTIRKSEIDHSLDNNQDLLLMALRSALNLLGGPEQTERVFRFLQNEYGISLDKQQGIDEKTVASALTGLFGRGSELLLSRFREEIARSGIHSSKSRSTPKYSDIETVHRTQYQAKGGRK
ncbi:MAG: hypothetical protein ACREBU_19795, partial [Nitrososphaera sp.]